MSGLRCENQLCNCRTGLTGTINILSELGGPLEIIAV